MPPEKKVEELFEKENEEFGAEKPAEPEEEKLSEEELEEIKNRRYRRLEQKWQAERESNIALNAKLQAISESQKFREETGSDDIDQTIARIYGTNTPEAAEATKLLQEALNKSTEKAVDKAMERFNEKLQADDEEVSKEESNIDSFIETIEDEYNVDLSSNTAQSRKLREGFLDQLEKLSFKRNGEIVEFADPMETWDVCSRLSKPSTTRAKELGARSMTRSGSSPEMSEGKANEAWLREHDLI